MEFYVVSSEWELGGATRIYCYVGLGFQLRLAIGRANPSYLI